MDFVMATDLLYSRGAIMNGLVRAAMSSLLMKPVRFVSSLTSFGMTK